MAHGMTTSALRQRLRAGGPWQRLLPGVFLAVTGTPTTEQRSMAALADRPPRDGYRGLDTELVDAAVRRAHTVLNGAT